MTPSVSNVAAYSIQFAVLVGVALIATRILRLRTPLPSLRFWQLTLVAAILLPLLQPGSAATAGQMLESSATFVASSAAVTAFTTRGVDVAEWIVFVIVRRHRRAIVVAGSRFHSPPRHHRQRGAGHVARRDRGRAVRHARHRRLARHHRRHRHTRHGWRAARDRAVTEARARICRPPCNAR